MFVSPVACRSSSRWPNLLRLSSRLCFLLPPPPPASSFHQQFRCNSTASSSHQASSTGSSSSSIFTPPTPHEPVQCSKPFFVTTPIFYVNACKPISPLVEVHCTKSNSSAHRSSTLPPAYRCPSSLFEITTSEPRGHLFDRNGRTWLEDPASCEASGFR